MLVNEAGSIAAAARRLRQPQGSLRGHIRRLEDEIGAVVLHRNRPELTEAGSLLLDYARQMLELHDDALESVLARGIGGTVRIGIAQDVEQGAIPLIARLTRSYAAVTIETQVERSRVLFEATEAGQLDFAIAFTETNGGTRIGQYQPAWLGTKGWTRVQHESLRLILLDPPCLFRDIALHALEEAGAPAQIVLSSPSLSSLWTAVSAGLGVTVRPAASAPPGIAMIDGLPPVPPVYLMILNAPGDPSPATKRCRDLLAKFLADMGPVGAMPPRF